MSFDVSVITRFLYSWQLVDESTLSYVTSAMGVSNQDKAHRLVQNCSENILMDQHPMDRLKGLLDILRNVQPAAEPVADRILEEVL